MSVYKDWEVEIGFKNFPVYRVPWLDLDYTWGCSQPGGFSATLPLNSETLDILRGSEISFLYRGEKAFSGIVLNKTPDSNNGVIKLMGVDWNGLMFDRQIGFQPYDPTTTVYSYDRTDYWDWDKTKPPAQNVDIEGSAAIKLMMKHYLGEGVDDSIYTTDERLYGFDTSNMEVSINKERWRFEGESLGEAFGKISTVMQSSTTRIGYNWWIDPYKKYWLQRYGDMIYKKPLMATWGPPEEDSSSVINHLHLLGGIATPFPDDREGLTDTAAVTALRADNTVNLYHDPPDSNSDGWGCWIKRSADDSAYIRLDHSQTLGSVTGENGTAVYVLVSQSTADDLVHNWGFYYSINDDNSPYRDANYPGLELRNWSNRNQDSDKVGHQIRTLTFYLRITEYAGDTPSNPVDFIQDAKLKIYTNSAAPAMDGGGGNDHPEEGVGEYETANGIYDLNITEIFTMYKEKYGSTATDENKWMRVLIVFDEGVESDTWANSKMTGAGGGGGAGGIKYKIVGITEGAAGAEVAARWDVISDKTAPNPSDIWGFGFEFMSESNSGGDIKLAIDHLFFGFGEIEVERRDATSIAALNREITRWIHDRHCHSWGRGEHLADVLLDSLKYSQKSRSGVIKYFNPELRPNLLIPLVEEGVEWTYVLDKMDVSVNKTGVKQTLHLGTPRPSQDDLLEFYQVTSASMQAAGAGKTVHDWVANTKCFTRCEMFCEFACLSDWSSIYKRGGSVCQTSRELTCTSCESTEELNACVVACMKYSQIASISQKSPAERDPIETTLLTMGPKVSAHVPPERVKKEYTPTEKLCRTLKAGLKVK